MASSVTLFAKQAWAAGGQFAEVAVPAGTTQIKVAMDRTSLTGTQVRDAVKIDLYISEDDGRSWRYRGGVGIPTGAISGVTESAIQVGVRGINRVRVWFTCDRSMNVSLVATFSP